MTEPASSYRSIVRSTAVVGGASLGVLLIGLIRAKAFALLLGPSGVGLFGLYNAIVATGAAVAGMGLSTSAVRQVANPDDEPRTVRKAIWILACLLAAVGGVAIWALRDVISYGLAGDGRLSAAIAWLAIAVSLTVLASIVPAMLQGLRRLSDLARVNLIGALAGTVTGIALVAAFRLDGVLAATLAAPAALVLVGLLYARRIGAGEGGLATLPRLIGQWRPMIILGGGVMIASLLGTLAQLGIRTITLRALGLEAVGLFQAAITITTMNVGLVLAAMAADYFPRLSQAAADPRTLNSLLNQQLHVAILLSTPILLTLSAGASLWLPLLYSGAFTGASDLLRWQVAAEALRLLTWSIAFVLLARNDLKAYVATELTFTMTVLPATWLLVQDFELVGIGLAQVGAHLITGTLAAILAWRRHRVRPTGRTVIPGLVLLAIAVALAMAGERFPASTAIFGSVAALAAGLWAIVRLHREDALPGPLRPMFAGFARWLRRAASQ